MSRSSVVNLIRRRKGFLIIFWVFVLVAAMPFAPQIIDSAKDSFDPPPGTESYEAQQLIEEEFPSGVEATHVVVIKRTDGGSIFTDDAVKQFTLSLYSQIMGGNYPGVKSFTGYYILDQTGLDSLKHQFISEDLDTTFIAITTEGEDGITSDENKEFVEDLRDVIEGIGFSELETFVTGLTAEMIDTMDKGTEDMERIDMFVIPLIVVALLVILRNPRLVPLPLIGILTTLVISFAIIGQIAEYTDIWSFVPNVMMVMAIAIGVDYALFMVSRFKEERMKSHSVEDSWETMMENTGHTILVSGLTLAAAFIGLIFFPMSFFSGIGIGILVVVLVSLAVNLTFIPAILARFGEKLTPVKAINPEETRAKSKNTETTKKSKKQSVWRSISKVSTKHSKVILVVVVLAAFPVVVQVANMNQSYSFYDFIPDGSDSKEGLLILEEEFSPGVLVPLEIIVKTGVPDGVWTKQYFDASQDLIETLIATNFVGTFGITSHTWLNGSAIDYNLAARAIDDSSPVYTDSTAELYRTVALQHVDSDDGDTAHIQVILQEDPMSEKSRDWLSDVRNKIIPSISGLSSYQVLLGGPMAFTTDMMDQTYDYFPWIILLVIVMISSVVGILLRSVIVPGRLLATVGLTIAWIYGATVLFFEKHWGSVFKGSINSLDGVFWVVPVITFPILIGLGMDYDLFIVTRIKEEVWKGKSNKEAIASALESTGGIVTGAAAIMVIAFAGLMLGSTMGLVLMGFILAFAVLIDATVVRIFLVPAIMSLAEDLNWWPSHPPSV